MFVKKKITWIVRGFYSRFIIISFVSFLLFCLFLCLSFSLRVQETNSGVGGGSMVVSGVRGGG